MQKVKAKSVADWRNIHDRNVTVPAKIKAALEAIRKEGPENWEYESDLMKRAGISQTDIGQFREQFEDHIVVAPATSTRNPRRAWFGDAKVAKSLRGE